MNVENNTVFAFFFIVAKKMLCTNSFHLVGLSFGTANEL